MGQAGWVAAVVATGVLVVAGCHAGGGGTGGRRVTAAGEARVDLDAIVDRGWTLAAWGDGEPAAAEPEVTLRYAAGSFAGRSGCNRYTAPVERRPGFGSIAVGAIAGTRMMCPEPVFAVESRFLAALARAKAVELRSDRLRLVYTRNDGREAVLEFRGE